MTFIQDTFNTLHNHVEIPALGFGFSSDDKNTYNKTLLALSCSYRHFHIPDDAQIQKEFTRALESSDINRGDIFLSLTINTSNLSLDHAIRYYHNMLSRLHTDYVDALFLKKTSDNDDVSTTWRVIEDAYKNGSARAIGISNGTIEELENILYISEISPMIWDTCVYPGYAQNDKLLCAKEHKIQVEGYLPQNSTAVLSSRELSIFAEKYKTVPCAVFTKYLLQKHCNVLLFEEDEAALRSAYDAYHFTLSEDELKYLDVIHNYG